MSQFIDRVVAELISEKRLPAKSFLPLSVVSEFSQIDHIPVANKYRVGVRWGYNVIVENKHLDSIINNCVRELREAIYGDIKNIINRLQRAFYERDADSMEIEIRDLIREVWGENK